MTLAEHPRAEWNDLWLLLEVIHEGKQPQVLGENVTSDVTQNKDDFHQGYRNRFLATPWDAHYRPALEHPKPKVLVPWHWACYFLRSGIGGSTADTNDATPLKLRYQ